MERLIKEKQAAELLSISVQTLRNDRSGRRRFPFVKLGKLVRYRPEDLVALIAEHRVPSQELPGHQGAKNNG